MFVSWGSGIIWLIFKFAIRNLGGSGGKDSGARRGGDESTFQRRSRAQHPSVLRSRGRQTLVPSLAKLRLSQGGYNDVKSYENLIFFISSFMLYAWHVYCFSRIEIHPFRSETPRPPTSLWKKTSCIKRVFHFLLHLFLPNYIYHIEMAKNERWQVIPLDVPWIVKVAPF